MIAPEFAESLVTADYVNVVVGENLSENYNPSDVIDLAEAIGADILAVTDSDEILPDGDETSCYLGRLYEHFDSIRTADGYLIVGVAISNVNDIPWNIFRGEGIVMTRHPRWTYNSAASVSRTTLGLWMPGADADTLEELATNVIDLAASASGSVSTIYSNRDEDPSPPSELISSYDHDLSSEVKRCEVCHTLSNNKISIGARYPGPSIEWQCPAVAHRNHERLEKMLDKRKKLIIREDNCDKTTEAGQRALHRVKNERAELISEIETLRDWFDGRFDDIVSSDPDLSYIPFFSPRDIEYSDG